MQGIQSFVLLRYGKINNFTKLLVHGFGELIQSEIFVACGQQMRGDDHPSIFLSKRNIAGHPRDSFRGHLEHHPGFGQIAELQAVVVWKIDTLPFANHTTNFVVTGNPEVSFRNGEFKFCHDILIGLLFGFPAVVG